MATVLNPAACGEGMDEQVRKMAEEMQAALNEQIYRAFSIRTGSANDSEWHDIPIESVRFEWGPSPAERASPVIRMREAITDYLDLDRSAYRVEPLPSERRALVPVERGPGEE